MRNAAMISSTISQHRGCRGEMFFVVPKKRQRCGVRFWSPNFRVEKNRIVESSTKVHGLEKDPVTLVKRWGKTGRWPYGLRAA